MSIPGTIEEAVTILADLDAERWGEAEREVSLRLRRQECPTLGLALNAIAQHTMAQGKPWQGEMDRAARAALTAADMRRLRQAL